MHALVCRHFYPLGDGEYQSEIKKITGSILSRQPRRLPGFFAKMAELIPSKSVSMLDSLLCKWYLNFENRVIC